LLQNPIGHNANQVFWRRLRFFFNFCSALQVHNSIARIVVIAAALFWAMRASVPFVAGSVGDERRYLAVFPLTLMYAVLGWLTFIS
jgi:hypothetical protein